MLVSLPDLYPKGRAVSFQKQEDFLVETKRNKHIRAGYNALP